MGCCNVGKSSLFNTLVGQDVSIVSNIEGTTTDAVFKNYELIPVGAITFCDTAGFDDLSKLGEKRKEKTYKILEKSDFIVLVCAEKGITLYDKEIIRKLQTKNIPFVLIFNKIEQITPKDEDIIFCEKHNINTLNIPIKNGAKILQDYLAQKIKQEPVELFDKNIQRNDIIILVMPIDDSAPKGRLILAQVQTIRESLDAHAIVICVQPSELEKTLASINRNPKLVVSDSQVVKHVSKIIPSSVNLTTFSMLFARLKGDLPTFLEGANFLKQLNDEDKILICESCSHKICSDDIAHVKIPRLITAYTGKKFIFEYMQGIDFPDNLSQYQLVVHCGACMFNRAEMIRRIEKCKEKHVPITNFGVLMAKINHLNLGKF